MWGLGMPGRSTVIGIDLGTTTSGAARVLPNRIVEVISSLDGGRLVPSAVLFQDKPIVGSVALDEQAEYPRNTVVQIKRIMGKSNDSPAVKNLKALGLFKIIRGSNNTPPIEISDSAETLTYTPEQISSFILRDIMSYSKARVTDEITGVVVTVPAYFDNAQREATIQAAKLANIPLLQLLNEPTAAAFSLMNRAEMTEHSVDKSRFLVFDFGGGTCDISVLQARGYALTTLAVDGNTNLGGSDITEKVFNWAMEEFRIQHNIDVTDDPASRVGLRKSCEIAKCRLSNLQSSKIYCTGRTKTAMKEFNIVITRGTFERICTDIFEECTNLIRSALQSAGIGAQDINFIALAGGSSRIPRLQKDINAIFPGARINQAEYCEEAVVKGAALYAKHVASDPGPWRRVIYDVMPFSLGTILQGCTKSIVIPKNTKIPAE
eukprot:Gregarina_sp_Poly_1__941@NODE_1227_length_4719_cov_70_628762_g835_i0_p1_GENE_NODE_1227_length_4719_cov_70_628762_g835_i0NODE_1227_length_4719_cov_70_628762_g835_i0_p1_ORF_typecomplete_len435_score41_65HSP70/PF00012_20/2_4e82MreB_Mbl/PF06723_13/3_4e03MreB_Mbl/PF06723_13/4e19StbA/PF06406_11/5_4e03StbA/PF06406_11/1_1e08PilM_2/PF11104_8/7_5e05Hydantoinase_A/PF01968_18/84Hydantoinase_A/PF01968_18/0_026Hydantoinase_A/PF01968_18/4_3e03FtsA/PF14450_6/5_6e03FtsA/PF14450_6/0_0045FGGY_N/PF00370_21/2_1e02FG